MAGDLTVLGLSGVQACGDGHRDRSGKEPQRLSCHRRNLDSGLDARSGPDVRRRNFRYD
jgi:hypothetical protein